jgi:hypothetical protein
MNRVPALRLLRAGAAAALLNAWAGQIAATTSISFNQTELENAPTIWVFKRAKSKVRVLPVPDALPSNYQLQPALRTVVRGSELILIAPDYNHVSPMNYPRLAIATLLPQGESLDAIMTKEQKHRFGIAAEQAGKSKEDYSKMAPIWAVYNLRSDYRKRQRLVDSDQIFARVAEESAVPVRPIFKSDPTAIIDELLKMPEPGGRTCIDAVLGEIDFDSGRLSAVVTLWSEGKSAPLQGYDVRAYFDDCLLQSPSYRASTNAAIEQFVERIRSREAAPGDTLVLVPMKWFFGPDGVLSRLER